MIPFRYKFLTTDLAVILKINACSAVEEQAVLLTADVPEAEEQGAVSAPVAEEATARAAEELALRLPAAHLFPHSVQT